MAVYDYETLAMMQTVFDTVIERACDPPHRASEPIRETVAKSIMAITAAGEQDLHQIERYALAKALTALAGLTA